MTALGFDNLEANVPSARSNMVGLTNAKIDVSNVTLVGRYDAKMVEWNETSREIGRLHLNETQSDLPCE
jgi:hypothetical protein